MIYGIYATTTHITPLSVVLSAFLIVGWVLQIVFEVVLRFFVNRANFLLEGLEADIETITKPAKTVGNFFKKMTGKEIEPEKNPLKYALFVSFFPQLVAGPIERSSNLLRQIQNVHLQKKIRYEKFTNGFALMLYGYFQKVFIADKAAVLANTVFANPGQYSTVELALGAIAFSIQIYCDFAAYSTIAIGAAKVMGFELMENFDTPYFAKSIKEFWRRWHISLSSWFRDYLYIPMGGKRKGKIRKYFNLLVTFLVSGLWHGASWNYVVWGGLHGVYQIFGEITAPVRKKLVKILQMRL